MDDNKSGAGRGIDSEDAAVVPEMDDPPGSGEETRTKSWRVEHPVVRLSVATRLEKVHATRERQQW